MMAWNLLLILFIVALVASAVGFKKYVYFLSLGYGFSIAAGAVAIAVLEWGKLFGAGAPATADEVVATLTSLGGAAAQGALPAWLILIQLVLFVVYGFRLSGFLLIRELKSASYRKTLGEATKTDKPMPIFVKVTIWVTVAVLYAMQVSPVLYRIENGAADLVCPLIGVCISILGIVIESIADKQKSEQKAKRPDMVATQGLYKFVRCPNYFGEITFWTGVFVGSWSALQGAGQWALAAIAWVCIVLIMFNGAQRLEKRQMGRYGKNAEYKAYADKTPIIIPLLPVYHLNKEDK